jgi:hypothetical protein
MFHRMIMMIRMGLYNRSVDRVGSLGGVGGGGKMLVL